MSIRVPSTSSMMLMHARITHASELNEVNSVVILRGICIMVMM